MDRYISTPNTQELEQLGEIVCQCFASALSESESYLNRIGRENFRIITDGNQAMPSSGRGTSRTEFGVSARSSSAIAGLAIYTKLNNEYR